MKRELTRGLLLFFALSVLLTAWVTVSAKINGGLFSHNAYDQHTRQALAWRDGRMHLVEDAPWLELAQHRERQYVSFPPVPTVLEWILSFKFDNETPSNLTQVLVAFVGLLGFWAYFWAAGGHPARSLALALGVCLGSNYLWLSLSGSVWFVGQITGCALAIWGCHFLIHGQTARAWCGGALLLALAVGCRPFYALLFPLVWLWPEGSNLLRRRFWWVLCGATPVALTLAAYNLARFGIPWEFGHSYLPLYLRGNEQFSGDHFSRNLNAVFASLPGWKNGRPIFSIGGNAIWLVAPIFTLGLLVPFARVNWQRKLLWACTVTAVWLPLLLHHSNGSAQWGYRYMVDLLPLLAIALGATLAQWRWWVFCLPILLLSVAMNVLGAYIWYRQPQSLQGQPWVSVPVWPAAVGTKT